MEARKTPTGIVVLQWYFIILGGISILLGLVLPPIFAGIMRAAMLEAEPELYPISAVFGLIAFFWGLFGVGYGAFQVLIGVFLGKGRGWARIAALVVGILSLFNVPVGTVLGILCLVFLLGEEGKAYFGG
jgi:hypothetical protein